MLKSWDWARADEASQDYWEGIAMGNYTILRCLSLYAINSVQASYYCAHTHTEDSFDTNTWRISNLQVSFPLCSAL